VSTQPMRPSGSQRGARVDESRRFACDDRMPTATRSSAHGNHAASVGQEAAQSPRVRRVSVGGAFTLDDGLVGFHHGTARRGFHKMRHAVERRSCA
jgi:hypothetical protein